MLSALVWGSQHAAGMVMLPMAASLSLSVLVELLLNYVALAVVAFKEVWSPPVSHQ
jgi:hypothetical protein